MGDGVGEGIMLMYRCALFIKYCRGDVVARVPSVPTNVERESLKRCLMWVECLACVQTSPPTPSGKIGRGVSSPDFFWGGGTSVHRLLSVLLVLSYSERFFSGYSGFPFSSKTSFSNFNSIRNGRWRITPQMCRVTYLINLFVMPLILVMWDVVISLRKQQFVPFRYLGLESKQGCVLLSKRSWNADALLELSRSC